MMALFDSHCHVDEPKFDDDREDVLTRMAEAGVTRYAVIGSDMATSRHSADFAAAHLGCYAAIGIHPHEAKGFVEDDLQRLADWSKEEKVVAIGEIGLDYYYDLSPRETQMTVCEAQMELAWELSLPVAYHIRDAHQDMLDIMKRHKKHLTGGIIHCFSGSWEVEVASPSLVYRSTCGCSSMVELQPSKLVTWVRFPSPAPAQRVLFMSSPQETVRKGGFFVSSALPAYLEASP